MPYSVEVLYPLLSLDTKARLAAQLLTRENGCPPNGPQIARRMREIDARDRLHPAAARKAAAEQRRVMEVNHTPKKRRGDN